jgi:hypothetical protein
MRANQRAPIEHRRDFFEALGDADIVDRGRNGRKRAQNLVGLETFCKGV